MQKGSLRLIIALFTSQSTYFFKLSYGIAYLPNSKALIISKNFFKVLIVVVLYVTAVRKGVAFGLVEKNIEGVVSGRRPSPKTAPFRTIVTQNIFITSATKVRIF